MRMVLFTSSVPSACRRYLRARRVVALAAQHTSLRAHLLPTRPPDVRDVGGTPASTARLVPKHAVHCTIVDDEEYAPRRMEFSEKVVWMVFRDNKDTVVPAASA